MKHPNFNLLPIIASLLAFPSTSPFVPSIPTTTLRKEIPATSFRFYASDDSQKKPTRKIRIHVDQQVSVRRAANADSNGEDGDNVSDAAG